MKSLSTAKCRCASRLARNCTSRFSSASRTASTLPNRVGMTTAVRNSAGIPPSSCRSSLGERAGREEGGDELVDHVDRDVDGRDQREQPAPRATPCAPPARPARAPRRAPPRCRPAIPPHEDEVGVPQDPAVHRLAHAGPVAGGRLQLGEPLVDQVVAHVGAERGLRPVVRARPGELHRARGPRPPPAAPGPPGDPLDDVAVLVAGGEGHPRVEPRGVLAQHRLDGALPLDERLPVQVRDGAQAGDAVAPSSPG